MTRTFGADGGSISVKFDSAGRPTSADTVDANGKLTSVTCHVPAVCAGALNQQQKQLSAANTLKANTKPQGLTATKPNVKADVLQQIQGKSSGDLSVAKDKLKTTGMANRINKSGAASDLNPQPLPPGPPPDKVGKNMQLDNKINIASYKSAVPRKVLPRASFIPAAILTKRPFRRPNPPVNIRRVLSINPTTT